MRVVATAAALSILPLLHIATATDDRSLTDIESRIGNSRIQVPDPDSNTIGALREKLLLAETTISALTATVAEMGNSAEATRRELEDAKLRMESLGVSSGDSNTETLEARLLQCLRELRVLRDSNEIGRGQLLMLSEAVQMLMLTSADTNPQSRMAVEAELRKTSEVLGVAAQATGKATAPSLNDGMVIDFKDEISLVVVNLGKSHGVKIGMPFQILRSGKVIGMLKIVDVREKISGGVIQSHMSEDVRIVKGDTIKVAAEK